MRVGDGQGGKEPASTTGWVAAALALSLGLAVTGGAVVWQQQQARAEAKVQMALVVDRLQADLTKRLTLPVYGLKGARGAIAATGGPLSRTAFRAFVESRNLSTEFPGVRGFGFMDAVRTGDLPAFVDAQRRDGAPEFAVRGRLQADLHFIASQVEPMSNNAGVLGLDVAYEPIRVQVIEQAISTGDTALSGPITLVQDARRGLGFLMLVPVFKAGRDPGTPNQRRAALAGLLFAPLVADEILSGATDAAADMLDLRLSVRGLGDALQPLLGTHQGNLLRATEAADLEFADTPLAETRNFSVAGRAFVLEAALNPATSKRLLGLTGASLTGTGSLLSLLLAATVYLLVAGRTRAENLARSMTADLSRLAMVASRTTNAVVITDAQRRITWVNEGFTRITGYRMDEALGQWPGRLLQFDQTDPRAIQQMHTALEAGQPCQVDVLNRTKDGRACWLNIEIQPLHDANRELTGFMAVQSDITVRKQLEAQAEEARIGLQDLYDNAPCAYYSLDRHGRFLQVNALGLAWLGCTAAECIGQLGIADFLTAEDRQRFELRFAQIQAGVPVPGVEFDLIGRGGEARRVSVSSSAILDAEGQFLRTRSAMFDITETHRIRQQLQQLSLDQEAMLESDLVGITKLRGRVAVWRNRALERMFGYDEGELLGATARVLYSDDASYENLGKQAYPVLQRGERFRTQLRMRRKDNSLFWVDLSGSLLPGGDGTSLWLMVDITHSKAYEEQIERAALHDALTGLPNRLLLADRAQLALSSAQRSGNQFTMAYLDLNGFKLINDTHGHEAGDEVLKAVAARLQSAVRGTDTVARLGGDEFVVLLSPTISPAEAEPVLARLLDELMQPIKLPGGVQVEVGTSLGLAHYPQDGSTTAELMHHADEAMYANKRAGRARASIS